DDGSAVDQDVGGLGPRSEKASGNSERDQDGEREPSRPHRGEETPCRSSGRAARGPGFAENRHTTSNIFPPFPNAPPAPARSARSCAAETWQRSRACPCGTTGKPKPDT